MTVAQERRAGNTEFALTLNHVHGCVESLKVDVAGLRKDVAANTEITAEIRDAMAWFKVTGKVAVWVGGVAGGLAGVFELLKVIGIV